MGGGGGGVKELKELQENKFLDDIDGTFIEIVLGNVSCFFQRVLSPFSKPRNFARLYK